MCLSSACLLTYVPGDHRKDIPTASHAGVEPGVSQNSLNLNFLYHSLARPCPAHMKCLQGRSPPRDSWFHIQAPALWAFGLLRASRLCPSGLGLGFSLWTSRRAVRSDSHHVASEPVPLGEQSTRKLVRSLLCYRSCPSAHRKALPAGTHSEAPALDLIPACRTHAQ